MKKILITSIAILFSLSACHDDDYITGLRSPGNEDDSSEMAERVEGRVAISYVTYYGTTIPNTT